MNNDYSISASPVSVSENIIKANPILAKKITQNCKLETKRVGQGLLETVRFLDLIGLSNKHLTPSIDVDLIWHELILFTRLYTNLCDQRYGRYIHHNPADSDEQNKSRFCATIHLYKLAYGEPDPVFWGTQSSICSTNCGSCEAE